MKLRTTLNTLMNLLWILALAACAAPAAITPEAPAATQAPATEPVPTPTEAPAATLGGQIRLELAGEGNEARYRVREQLANLDLPNDAVGATSAIAGGIVLKADGAVVSEESTFTVDLTTLKSDQGLRDRFIQNNTLETRQFPTAKFVVTDVIGLPVPPPTAGALAFQLVGDLTVHGVTRPTTWEVTAEVVEGAALVGTATTHFTFGDFDMTIPRVARVLSIEDNIILEYDFRLVLAD